MLRRKGLSVLELSVALVCQSVDCNFLEVERGVIRMQLFEGWRSLFLRSVVKVLAGVPSTGIAMLPEQLLSLALDRLSAELALPC